MIRDLVIAVILSAIVVGVLVGMPGKVESALGRLDSDINLSHFFKMESGPKRLAKQPSYQSAAKQRPSYASARKGGKVRRHLQRNKVSYNDPRVSPTVDLPWVQ